MRALVVLAAIATGLVVVPTSGATIVINRGIGGITLGMTQAMVRGTIGEPERVRRGRNDFGPYTTLTFRDPPIQVTFQGNLTATGIITTHPSERTRNGVGVGSTQATVKAKVPGVKCRRETKAFAHCWVGRFLPGRTVTDFIFSGDRVSRVTVGIVID